MQTEKRKNAHKKVISTAPLLKDMTEEWLSVVRYSCKMSTYNKYYNLCSKHIIPVLGQYQISNLNNAVLEVFITAKLKNGKLNGKNGLAGKTVKDILSVLKQIIKYSERLGYFTACSDDIYKIRNAKSETRVLTESEQNQLIEYIMKDFSLFNTGILLCVYMGMRIGELCALKWSDIDLDNRIVHIKNTMQRIQLHDSNDKKTAIIITEPKSSSSDRLIPIPEFLLDILKRFQENPDCFFLSGSKRITEPRVIQYRFKKIMDKLGITNATLHTLRHTFATHCIEVGFDIKSLSEILGHSSVDITLNRYVHSSLEQKRKCMNLLSVGV